jgi:drug/metabolite transporter (DMT)-like permease
VDRPSSLKATSLGLTALFLWALSAFLISELHNIPTFQLSGTVFIFAFLYTCFQLTRKRQWSKINPSMIVLMVGFIAILNNQAAYVYSIKLIPPEQAEIIYYLWPILAVVISALFFEKAKGKVSRGNFLKACKSLYRLTKRKLQSTPYMFEEDTNEKSNKEFQQISQVFLHLLTKIVPVLSAVLGLAGIYVLLTDGKGLGEISIDRTEGYIFAFIAAGAWVLYSLFCRYNPDIPLEMNGIWCGMAAIPCFGIHCYSESLVMPTLYEWVLMVFIGIGILSYSLKMWSIGLRHGHFNTLSVMSYMTPLISVLILMIVGKAAFKSNILIACQLIILGAILCMLVEWVNKRMQKSSDNYQVD